MSVMQRLPRPDVGPFREGSFRSRLHDERGAAVLGIALGVCFSICFATGLYSHALQNPPSWFTAFPRPAGLYRVTQGLHIATGIAAIPLLAAKLWTVYPKLFEWPPFSGVAQFLERLLLLPLVGGSLFLLISGVNNINGNYRWYVFSFRPGHYRAAWTVLGALVVHIGAKIGVTRRALRRSGQHPSDGEHSDADADAGATAADARDEVPRRAFVGSVFATSALLTTFTVGQTFGPFRKLALLAPRRPDVGPQGFPVNRTARGSGLEHVDVTAYRLTIDGAGAMRPVVLTYEDLRAMPQHSAELPIACVEGWSASVHWRGVSLRRLLELVDATPGSSVTVHSLQISDKRPVRSDLTAGVARDVDTLMALDANGSALHPDHGFPLRLVAPNRPGVLQTKWIQRIEVHR